VIAGPGDAVHRRGAPGPREVPDQRDIRLYDATDIPWIATVVDHVVEARGQPWRILRERLEHSAIRAPRVAAILGALRRVLGGKAERARIARKVRALVLGHPALDDRQRAARLTAASEALGIEPAEVDQLMWIDLASERPVTLPEGRPDERRLAAYANLDRIQRAVRRARQLRLVVWGEAHELVRTAKRYGLLVTVSRSSDREATVLDIVGPLSLFHDTGVYGGALAGLIPLLADVPRFELTVHCDFGYGPSTLRVIPPVLLPPVVPRGAPSLAVRLARDLAKAAPELAIERDPPPIATGASLVFPDLAIDHAGTRIWIEVIGFATAEHVTAQRARYTAAGITKVLLCIHDKRAEAPPDDDPQILHFHGRLAAAAVLAKLGEAR
jgi:predicted nuclease of restriction endonuclease-like RecB superfamily